MRRGRLRRAARLAGALALFAVSSALMTGANFSAATESDGNNFAAAPDWVAPFVTMTDPGANLGGNVTLAATAGDTGSGVASVTMQISPAGADTWSTACTATSSPWSCSFDAGSVPEGYYDFRAVATDNGANSATSATVANRRIDNTAPTGVTMAAPATLLQGSVGFSGDATDAQSGMASLRFQYRLAGATDWSDACSDSVSPYSCSFNTATIADGLYDLRSLATDNAGNTAGSTVYTGRRVDNNAPTIVLNDPGPALAGTVELTTTASDGTGAGITSVVIQRSPAGTNTWTTICTDLTADYSCSLNTTTLPNGQYDFRAVATDGAGFTTTSAIIANRWVDNTVPATATTTDPGANLRGTISLGGTATDAHSGIRDIVIQRSTAGTNNWIAVCTDTTSPYSCSLDTTTLADGLYDFRAVATDYAGNVRNAAKAGNKRIDNTAPVSTMTDPGAFLRATVTLGATPTDTGGSGIASATIQRSIAGANTWTDVCTDFSTPYTCSLDTTTLSEGLYDFRVTSSDVAGNTHTSSIVADRRVDNTAPIGVTMADPGSPLAGSVTFSGDGSDPASGMASLKFQYKLSSSGTWLDACSDTSSPYGCSFNLATIADGTYDFRSLATDNAGNITGSTPYTNRIVNNGGPTTAMTDPGAMRGTVALGATATDGNGVASVTIQRSPAGAGTWTDVCTDNVSAYSCSLDTTTLPDGQYDFRAVAVDSLGSSTTSAVVASRWIDNAVPSVTMTDPGAYMRATVSLASTSSDSHSGVASVLYQKSPAGTNTWTTACTGATTPFSCSFNTTTVANGSYDFRAIATDAAGNQTTSAVVASRTIDNTAPAAADIQTTNAGVVNRPDAGDTVVFTATEQLKPESILAGWNGSLLTGLSVRIVNNAGSDEVEVWSGATKFNLGLINTRGDFISAGYMEFTTSSVVQSGSTFTVTLGGTAVAVNGATWRAAPGAKALEWTPTALVTDLAGNPIATTRKIETGVNDADF